MSNKLLKTVIIGFGKISNAYAEDPHMSKYFRYATHIQALHDHPGFEVIGVVDSNTNVLQEAKKKWKISFAEETIERLGDIVNEVEILVLATPPSFRLRVISMFPNLLGVLVEKPIANSYREAISFIEECLHRELKIQVNYWRRADRCFNELAKGKLYSLIGEVQAVTGVYGNGLANNGSHLVDFIRMLFGEINSVEKLGLLTPYVEGPIWEDFNAGFVLNLRSGLSIPICPISFSNYREIGLEIWGSCGHLSIMNEGLTIALRKSCANRAMSGEFEIPFDSSEYLNSTIGEALFEMYTNLYQSVIESSGIYSSAESALETHRIINEIVKLYKN